MKSNSELVSRVQSLEKLLQLELASADLMDDMLYNFIANYRAITRHNIALESCLMDILHYCNETGVQLGSLAVKAEAIMACKEPSDASK